MLYIKHHKRSNSQKRIFREIYLGRFTLGDAFPKWYSTCQIKKHLALNECLPLSFSLKFQKTWLSLLAGFLSCKNHSLHLIYCESFCCRKYHRVQWNQLAVKVWSVFSPLKEDVATEHPKPCSTVFQSRKWGQNLCGTSLFHVTIHQMYIWRLTALARSSCKSFFYLEVCAPPISWIEGNLGVILL